MDPISIAIAAALAAIAVSVARGSKAKAMSAPNYPGTPGVYDVRKIGIVPRGNISSPFGPRGPEGVHAGIDISAERGSAIRAAETGTVVDVSPNGERTGYGNTVIVQHGDGTLALYAHMNNFAPGIVPGVLVERGQVIGYVGSTHLPQPETNMAPHLHFEIHKNKHTTRSGRIIVNPDTPARIDPAKWLAKRKQRVADAS